MGIGANTAAFDVLYAVMLRALPVRDPGALVLVMMKYSGFQYSMSYPAYQYLRDHTSSLDSLMAFRANPINVTSGAATERLTGMAVPADDVRRLPLRRPELADEPSQQLAARALLVQLVPANQKLDVSMDAEVLGVSVLLGILTAIVLGFVTTWHSVRLSVIHALKGGTVAARGRLRKGLSVAQLALSVVVLLIAALFGQTLRKLRLVDSGFERDRVLIASVAPGGYSPERPNLLIDLPDQAGRITSTQASARQLQLGLRFVF